MPCWESVVKLPEPDEKFSGPARVIDTIEFLLKELKSEICDERLEESGIFRFTDLSGYESPQKMPTVKAARKISSLPDPTLVKAIIKSRSERNSLFGGKLFADPAWDMILDLLAAQAEFRRVSVSSLCLASGVPDTTALRWIAQLVDRGVFVRTNDVCDGRRVFISLSDQANREIAKYFSSIEVAVV